MTTILYLRIGELTGRLYPILASGVVQLSAVLSFALAAHWLSPADLGTWAMFLTLSSFVEMARVGLVQSATTHFTAQVPASERSALNMAALAMGTGAGIIGAVLLALAGTVLNWIWHLPGLTALLWCYPPVALLLAPFRWQESLALAGQNFRDLFRLSLVYGSTYLIFLGAAIVWFGALTPFLLLAGQVPAALMALWTRWDALRRSGFSLKIAQWGPWSAKIWRFGRFGMGSSLFSICFQRADVLLLAAFIAPAGLAAYHLAARLITWMDFPLNALSQAFAPKMAAANHTSGVSGVKRLYNRSVRLLLQCSLPLSVVAFIMAGELVGILGGGAYPEAAQLLRILLVANMAKPFGRMLGIALDAMGRPSPNFRMVLGSLAVNVVLLLVLVPILGAQGAALGSTVGVLLTTLVGQFIYLKILN